jgi:hypothetical protein
MSDFEERLKKAIELGQKTHAARQAEVKHAEWTASRLRIRHNDFRLSLSERIEGTLKALVNQLPGFEYENIFGDRGWGGAVSRDELDLKRGQRRTIFSRLELTIKPLTELSIVEIAAKGTVGNREIFVRSHHRPVQESEPEEFFDIIDRWVLEFAQLYSSAAAR